MKKRFVLGYLVLMLSSIFELSVASADEQETSSTATATLPYVAQPGDILEISVWKEEGLEKEVIVRPDGGISFPLVGQLDVKNKSLQQIEELIKEKLSQFIADPVVTVSAKQLLGNKIYVIGQVNRPGEYPINRYVDVMQALSMAGGMTAFASVNNIIILRRDEQGKQKAIEFEYGEVEDGDDLEQNIILKPGDVVVVP